MPPATLIQPVRKGRDLIDEIESTRPAPGTLAIWWLGQSGYLIKSEGGTLVIDPYLSEHLTKKYAGTARPHVRMTEAPLRGADLRGVDLVLASHKHSDHLDPGTLPDLMAASSAATLVVPEAILDHARGLGLPADRLVGLRDGGTVRHAGFQVMAIPSAHEVLDTDEQERHYYLGYLVEADGRLLYHSGDSLAYDGLAERLRAEPGRRLDVMFLPINGRDPARGVPGNMSSAEAVDLACHCRPRFIVPHHYDMFEFNTVSIHEFEAEARRLPGGVTPRPLRCGGLWEVGP